MQLAEFVDLRLHSAEIDASLQTWQHSYYNTCVQPQNGKLDSGELLTGLGPVRRHRSELTLQLRHFCITLWTSKEQTVNTCVIISASLQLPRPHLLPGRYCVDSPFHKVDAVRVDERLYK